MKAINFFFIFLIAPSVSFAQAVTYHEHVRSILQKRCMPCHTRDNVGAMPLSTYKEAAAYGSMIKYVTENKLMPPWKADGNYAHLKNYNQLTEQDEAYIQAWVKEGLPEGKVSGENQYEVSDKSNDFGKPDMVLAMGKPFTVKGDYTETAQVFVIPTGISKDELIEAIEFVPGNRKVVKTCTVSIDTGITGNVFDNNDLNYGYSSLTGLGFVSSAHNFYQWTPDGAAAVVYFPYAKKLPAGSNLLLHIVYAASTSIQADSSYIKIRFRKKQDSFSTIDSDIFLDSSHIVNGPFVVNVGEKRKFYAERKIEEAIDIHNVMPLGQFALSSWEIYAIDNLTQQRYNILKIPHWDAHWKMKYELEEPIRLSAGSMIYATGYYNNSDDNSSLLILPPKKIRYGEGQRDEMFYVQFDVVRPKK